VQFRLAQRVLSSGIEPSDELDEVKAPERSNRSGGLVIWIAKLHAGAGELDYADLEIIISIHNCGHLH
jgi:hypothetical protein